ncbi:MAG: hypothetical protein Q4D87_04595 [Actinomycetaceae bacterium]|nr:hypothetical protein [Actinomycetaceae bacterium]
MNDSQSGDRLQEFVNSADVKSRLADLDRAIVELRFTEGLRRNWAAARAEASVELAHFESTIDGARTDLAELRVATLSAGTTGSNTGLAASTPSWMEKTENQPGAETGGTNAQDGTGATGVADPSVLHALDYWKAHRFVERTWPPLNSRGPVRVVEQPLPRVLSGIHKILTGRLASEHLIREGDVAIPSDPQALQGVNQILNAQLPAPVRAGLLIWFAGQRPAFASHSVQVARTFARHHLVMSGYEPTGTLLASLEVARSNDALAAFSNPDPRPWLSAYIDAMRAATGPTLEMIRHVQAGRLPQ